MSNFWSGYIIALTVVFLVLITWLLFATRKGQRPDQTNSTTGHEYDGIAELDNPLPRWWFMLFVATLVFTVIYLILYPGMGKWPGVLGWTQVNQYEREVERAEEQFAPIFARYTDLSIAEVARDEEARRIGQRLFATNCSVCHGSDARGAFGFPNLTDNDWLWGGEPEQILTTLQRGRQAAMPAWLAVVGEEGVRNVSGYVRSLAGLESEGVDIEAGQKVFAANCVACHGPDGKGNPLLGAPNLTDDVWLYGSSMLQVQHTVRAGRNGNMPSQAHLGDDKLHMLASYVYGLSLEDK
ncbi:cytochrome c oxidase, cbb3-type subunit III [Pseudomonas saudimassiliensis]|uniref:Cbb3-type cytochrome c oxidase subunit n=1 Tax=Pseudomonas saudimassiliensis TaxID=1461581 RepID=A0A078MJ44_9PSED|nr:cytochrome-c oxidase, cbb3-type subunit III [Pseudomonas saudimassiliensis]CEA06259.1 cytochrome c oxidase, cbb3-type subunit III [Pseudomonas saudimassiliensis]CEF27684.1 cytochrome c oxidase, cbb3-type subunit III [Pseudomonas saudimassiliensis]